jgi:magnesium transporter
MIIAYKISDGNVIEKIEMSADDTIPKGVVWLDLVEPSIEEEKMIERALKIDAPTREEMDKIEVMSPFYKEGDSYYMTITAINKAEKDYPEGTAIIFILHPKYLVTLRYARPRSFSSFSTRALRNASLCLTPDLAFEGLIESIVNNLADVLEKAGNNLDTLLIDVFEKPSSASKNIKNKKKRASDEEEFDYGANYYDNIIKRVGRMGNLISKTRESLVSINRMLIFFSQIDEGKYLSKKEHRLRFRNLSREIHSLTEYANFLSQRNSFLLDATLGMLNVEQNMIIKVFTVAAAVFFPPTLIASVYGMNFKDIPELSWSFGYPLSILIMVLSAVLPYYYFKKKGWL